MSQVSKCCGAKVLIQGANSTTCGICLQPCDLIEAPVSLSEKKRIEALTKPKCKTCNDSKHIWAENGKDLIDCHDCTPKSSEASEFVKEMREKYRDCEDIGYACSIIESQENEIKWLKGEIARDNVRINQLIGFSNKLTEENEHLRQSVKE